MSTILIRVTGCIAHTSSEREREREREKGGEFLAALLRTYIHTYIRTYIHIFINMIVPRGEKRDVVVVGFYFDHRRHG